MISETDTPLRLAWRKTWPDQPDDFVANSPVPFVTIGRIMLTVGGPKNGEWQWTYQVAIKGLPWGNTGSERLRADRSRRRGDDRGDMV